MLDDRSFVRDDPNFGKSGGPRLPDIVERAKVVNWGRAVLLGGMAVASGVTVWCAVNVLREHESRESPPSVPFSALNERLQIKPTALFVEKDGRPVRPHFFETTGYATLISSDTNNRCLYKLSDGAPGQETNSFGIYFGWTTREPAPPAQPGRSERDFALAAGTDSGPVLRDGTTPYLVRVTFAYGVDPQKKSFPLAMTNGVLLHAVYVTKED